MAKKNKQAAPPPPLFLGQKERNLVKQINDEIIEYVIGQRIAYYPVSLEHSNFHPLYGESINKSFTDPVHINVLVDFDDNETNTTNYGIDRRTRITVHFHKRRLTEDQDLFVREGDFVLYGEQFYEIVKLREPKEIYGQIDHKMEVSAECVRARKGTFTVETHRRNEI